MAAKTADLKVAVKKKLDFVEKLSLSELKFEWTKLFIKEPPPGALWQAITHASVFAFVVPVYL